MKKENIKEIENRAERFEQGKASIITGENPEEVMDNLLNEVYKRSKTRQKKKE